MANNRSTKTGQFLKGKSGNPNGRPKGSRNKASLVKAQITLDNTSQTAAKLFEAVISRDAAKLEEFGLKEGDVNLKSMMEAAKIVITQSAGEMKALAQDSKKDSEKGSQTNEKQAPRFSAVASSK